MTSYKDSIQVQRLEVVNSGRNRRWSLAEKLRIVEESFQGHRQVCSTHDCGPVSPSTILDQADPFAFALGPWQHHPGFGLRARCPDLRQSRALVDHLERLSAVGLAHRLPLLLKTVFSEGAIEYPLPNIGWVLRP